MFNVLQYVKTHKIQRNVEYNVTRLNYYIGMYMKQYFTLVFIYSMLNQCL